MQNIIGLVVLVFPSVAFTGSSRSWLPSMCALLHQPGAGGGSKAVASSTPPYRMHSGYFSWRGFTIAWPVILTLVPIALGVEPASPFALPCVSCTKVCSFFVKSKFSWNIFSLDYFSLPYSIGNQVLNRVHRPCAPWPSGLPPTAHSPWAWRCTPSAVCTSPRT